MVDKIQKSLNKLSEKEKNIIKELLVNLKKGKTINLDIKKLKGRDDVYRTRKGRIRIIYRIANKKIFLLAIERRSDNTY